MLIALCLELELKNAGYEVCDHVVTGEEAVSCAQQLSPDCILMDIRLAGKIDGIEAAQIIQKQKSIPILFMTGYPDEAIEERASEINHLGYFIKPINAQSLKPALDSLK